MRLLVRIAVLLVAGFAFAGRMPAHAEGLAVDLELVLAVDVSGSVDAEEAALQREGYIQALTNPLVLQAVKNGVLGRIAVYYMEWANPEHRFTVSDWAVIDGDESARAFVARLQATRPTRGMYTSITGAIDFALPLFDANPYEGTRRAIDISGDGPNNIGGLITEARDRAIAKGVTINGLPIVNDKPSNFGMPPMKNLDLYYQDCVIGGPRAFLVVAEDFESFGEAIRRKLLIEIAGIDPETVPGTITARRQPSPLLVPAQNRWVPPCDEGERQLQQRRRGFLDY